MLNALTLLVLTGLSWVAVGAVVGAIGRRGFNLLYYQIIGGLIGLAISLAIGVASPETLLPPKGLPAGTWVGVVAGSFSLGFFNFFMIRFMGIAMDRGPNALVWAIIQSGLVYPFLMGWLVFGTPMGPARALGIVLIVASIGLYAARGGAGRAKSPETARQGAGGTAAWLVPSLLGMLFCGINQCGGNLSSYLPRGQEFPSFFRVTFVNIGTLAGCALQLAFDGARRRLPARPSLHEVACLLAFSAALNAVNYPVNTFLMFPGLDMLKNLGAGAMGYPVMVASCIVGFFPYGMLVLHERFSPVQLLGAVVGIAGIVLGCLH